MMRLFCS